MINEESDEGNSSNICSVCGDTKATKNYAAYTCVSCRIFFRRNQSLDLNINKCDLEGKCEINVNNRKCCRICRLKKMFSVGMNQHLFRSSHGKRSENEEKINTVELTNNEELILNNITDNYDIYSPILNINEIIKTSSNNPSKIRLKMGKNNLMTIQTYFYSSIISFIKINENFSSLSISDRRILLKRNIHNLSRLNQLFIYNEIQFLNDPIEKSLISDEYSSSYLENLLKSLKQMPSDKLLIKLFLIISTFSTCSDIVYFDINEFREENNCLSSKMNVLKTQNINVEILFKYLINHYGYDEASKQFVNLISNFFQQITYLQIGSIYEKHRQIAETILENVDDDDIMDLSD